MNIVERIHFEERVNGREFHAHSLCLHVCMYMYRDTCMHTVQASKNIHQLVLGGGKSPLVECTLQTGSSRQAYADICAMSWVETLVENVLDEALCGTRVYSTQCMITFTFRNVLTEDYHYIYVVYTYSNHRRLCKCICVRCISVYLLITAHTTMRCCVSKASMYM